MQNIVLGIDELKKIFNYLYANRFKLMHVGLAESNISFQGEIAATFEKDGIGAIIEFDSRIYEDYDIYEDRKDGDGNLIDAYNFVSNLYPFKKVNTRTLRLRKIRNTKRDKLSQVFNLLNANGFKLLDVVRVDNNGFDIDARFEKDRLTVFQGEVAESDSHIRAIIEFNSAIIKDYNIHDDEDDDGNLIEAYTFVDKLYTDNPDIGDVPDNVGFGNKKKLKTRKTMKTRKTRKLKKQP